MTNMILESRYFARDAHHGQTRKTSGAPYIQHPFLVADILENAGFSEEVVIAGNLHDTVEDTDVTIEQIRRKFGKEVADLVAFNTEDKSKTWEERKSHTVEHLKQATLNQKALVVADKFANLMELIKNHESIGESIWDAFGRGKDKQEWYFTNVLKSGKENLSVYEIPKFFNEYENALSGFFK